MVDTAGDVIETCDILVDDEQLQMRNSDVTPDVGFSKH